MVKYSEKEIINGLITEDREIIKYVYRKFFPAIQSLVKNYELLKLQDKDVFQEGLTRAIVNIRNGKFKGGSLFSTYLYSICKNICLKEVKRDKNNVGLVSDLPDEEEEDRFEVYNRILSIKDKLDRQCVEIVNLRFGLNSKGPGGIKFNEIAAMLDISHDNARQRFNRCLKKLKEFVMSDKIIMESI